jgi:polysaccharide pyruvyl transferase WcaK-like protein
LQEWGGARGPKRVKIAFYGLFGQKNLGNECTLQAMICNTRRFVPEAELICVCTDPADTQARHGIEAFPIRCPGAATRRNGPRVLATGRKLLMAIPRQAWHWVTAFKTLKGTDLFVAPGTGLLTDWGTSALGRPYDLFKWCLVARLRGCRVHFVSTGAGPVFQPASRWLIKASLALAHYRAYRDDFSRNYLERLRVDTAGDHVYPDLAFSLPPALMSPSPRQPGGRLTVGVGLMDYHGERGVSGGGESLYQEYLKKTGRFVSWLVEHNYNVRILIGDGSFDVRPRRDLRAMLERDGVIYGTHIRDDEPTSVEELLAQLAPLDAVVSPRFHNLLLALMLRKPVLSLSYHEKNTALMRSMGLGEYCQRIEEFDVAVLQQQFLKLMNCAGSLAAVLEHKAALFRGSLDEQYRTLFAEVSR